MIESNKSIRGQDDGPSSCTPTHICSDNNPGAKPLIKYEIEESLDIKEETLQDHQNKSESNKSKEGQNCGPSSCTPTHISSDNKSGAKTLIKYEIDESLDIKDEIAEDQQNKSESNKSKEGQNCGPSSCTPTQISSDNKSGAKTLIKYEVDESLVIKEEIAEDSERHQEMGHSLLSGKNQHDEISITTKTSCDNHSRPKTLIEYEDDETLEIKEEVIYDQGNVEQELGGKKKLRESKRKQKQKYKCEKCARSYLQKQSFYAHKKFECSVLLQFSCEFCDKKFKRKKDMNAHVVRVHQKTNPKASQTRHKCQKCLRSYSSIIILSRHKCLDRTVVKPQYICDYCGFQTNLKKSLPRHITSHHFQKLGLSAPGKKHKCEKCARSFAWKESLNRHKKFVCGVVPQFSCEFCRKKFKSKQNMNAHVVRVHRKTNAKASQTRHKCKKCFRSYSSTIILSRHKCLEQAVVKPQYICDYCGFQTNLKKNLPRHITSHHFQKVGLSVPERKYKCEKCARIFACKESLNRHKKFACGVAPQFSCEICDRAFRRKSYVNKHILRVHQKTNSKASQTRHKCNKCSRSYSFLSSLCFHKRTEHAVVNPWLICDYCGYQTKRKCNLPRHITSLHLNL